MKHVKIFEDYEVVKNYWRVKTSHPEFEISMNKLDIPDDQHDQFHTVVNRYHADYILLCYSSHELEEMEKWGWAPDKEHNFFKKQNYEYMGDVDITENDYKDWNLKNDTKKYNL